MSHTRLPPPEKNQYISAQKIHGEVPKGWLLCLECFEYYSDKKTCPICRKIEGENLDLQLKSRETETVKREEFTVPVVGKKAILPVQVHKMIQNLVRRLIVEFPKNMHYPLFFGIGEYLKICENASTPMAIYLKIRDKVNRANKHLDEKNMDGVFLLFYPHINGCRKRYYGIYSINQFEDKCFQMKKTERELTNILIQIKPSKEEKHGKQSKNRRQNH